MAAAIATLALLPASASADPDTACTGDGTVATATTLSEVENATLCLVNRYRQDNALAPLTKDTGLNTASQAHSQDMRANGYLAHDNPNNPFDTPAIRAFVAGYLYPVGENLGMTGGLGIPGVGTAWSLFDAWRHSSIHNSNMLGNYVASGLGVASGCWCGGANFVLGVMGTQMFGVGPANTRDTALNLNFGSIPGSAVKGPGSGASTRKKKCKKKRAKKRASAAKKRKCKKRKRTN